MTDVVPSAWTRAILVCGTCSKRVRGGWGPKGRTRLAKALRRGLGVSKGSNAETGVVETRCLGACQPRGVVVLDAAKPGRWIVARPGEDPAVVLAALGEPERAVEASTAPASIADWRALLRSGDSGQA